MVVSVNRAAVSRHETDGVALRTGFIQPVLICVGQKEGYGILYQLCSFAAERRPDVFETEIAERLFGIIADDEAGVVGLLDRPWRRKPAVRHAGFGP